MIEITKPQATAQLLPGIYEAQITSVDIRATQTGKRFIDAVCLIRAGQNAPRFKVDFKIWQAKEPNALDANFDGFMANRVLRLANSAGISLGSKFNSLDELFAALEGSPVKIQVENSEWNGRTYSNVTQVFPSELPLTPAEVQYEQDCKEHRMRKLLADVAPVPSAPAPAAKPAPAPATTFVPANDTEGNDEDVPF